MLPLEILDLPRRRAPIGSLAANDLVGWNPGLRTEHSAGLNPHVIADAYLAAHDHIFSHAAASGNARLSGNHAMPAYLYVVRHLHQVVNLGSAADTGLAERPAIYGRMHA